MLTLPTVTPESLGVIRRNWSHLPTRFINPGELDVLCALVARAQARTVIETGINTGRTAKAILEANPQIEAYVGIDVLPGYDYACKVQRNETPAMPGELVAGDPRVRVLVTQRGTFDWTDDDLPDAGAMFIDGDHSRKGVAHDTQLADALVIPGGVIIWHDYHDLGTVDVRDVLHERRAAGHDVVSVAGTWIAFEVVPGV